jgi:hypothetical protein
LEFQVSKLLNRKLKHEVRRKAIGVAFYGLIEISGAYAVQIGEIGIEQHLFTAQKSDCLRDASNWNDFFTHENKRAI